jgi:hypothetical protein
MGNRARFVMETFAFHHVGVAVRALSTTIPIYEKLFGYTVVRGPFDDPIRNVSVCLLSRGEGVEQQRGFSQARGGNQGEKAAARIDSVEKRSECFAVSVTQKEVTRVRRDPERLLSQLIKR